MWWKLTAPFGTRIDTTASGGTGRPIRASSRARSGSLNPRTCSDSGQRWLPSTTCRAPFPSSASSRGIHAVSIRPDEQVDQ